MSTLNWTRLGFPLGNWDEKKVWAIELPSVEMPLGVFLWHFNIPYWDSNTGEEFVIRPWDVIRKTSGSKKHQMRTRQANLLFPLDVLHYKDKWIVLDGVHRLVKAYLEGKTHVTVRILPLHRLDEIMVN